MADISELGFSIDIRDAENKLNKMVSTLNNVGLKSDAVAEGITKKFAEAAKNIENAVSSIGNIKFGGASGAAKSSQAVNEVGASAEKATRRVKEMKNELNIGGNTAQGASEAVQSIDNIAKSTDVLKAHINDVQRVLMSFFQAMNKNQWSNLIWAKDNLANISNVSNSTQDLLGITSNLAGADEKIQHLVTRLTEYGKVIKTIQGLGGRIQPRFFDNENDDALKQRLKEFNNPKNVDMFHISPLSPQYDYKEFDQLTRQMDKRLQNIKTESAKKAKKTAITEPAVQERSIQYEAKDLEIPVNAALKLSVTDCKLDEAKAAEMKQRAKMAVDGILATIDTAIGTLSITDVGQVDVSEESREKIRKSALAAIQSILKDKLGTAAVSYGLRASGEAGSVTIDEQSFKQRTEEALNAFFNESNANEGQYPSIKTFCNVIITGVNKIFAKAENTPLTAEFLSQEIKKTLVSGELGAVKVEVPMSMGLKVGRAQRNIDDIKLSIMQSFKEGGDVNGVTGPLEEALGSELDAAADKIRAAQMNALNKIASSATAGIEQYIEKVENATASAKKKVREKIGNLFEDLDANNSMKESLSFVRDIIRTIGKAPEQLEGKTSAISDFLDKIAYVGQQGSSLQGIAEAITKLNEIEKINPPGIKEEPDEVLNDWVTLTVNSLSSRMANESIPVGVAFDGNVTDFAESIKTSGIKVPLTDAEVYVESVGSVTIDDMKAFAESAGTAINEALKNTKFPVDITVTPTITADFSKEGSIKVAPDFIGKAESAIKGQWDKIYKYGGASIPLDVTFSVNPSLNADGINARVEMLLKRQLNNREYELKNAVLTVSKPSVKIVDAQYDTKFAGKAISVINRSLVNQAITVNRPKLTVANAQLDYDSIRNAVKLMQDAFSDRTITVRNLSIKPAAAITLTQNKNEKIKVDPNISTLLNSALTLSIKSSTLKNLQLYADAMLKIADSFREIAKAGVAPSEMKKLLKSAAMGTEKGTSLSYGKIGTIKDAMTAGAVSAATQEPLDLGRIEPSTTSRKEILKTLNLGELAKTENFKNLFSEKLALSLDGKSAFEGALKGINAFNAKNTSTSTEMENLQGAYKEGVYEQYRDALKNGAKTLEGIAKANEEFKKEIKDKQGRIKGIDSLGEYQKISNGILDNTWAYSAARQASAKQEGSALHYATAMKVNKDFSGGFGNPLQLMEDQKKQVDAFVASLDNLGKKRIKLDISGLSTEPLRKYQMELHNTQDAYVNMMNAMGVYVTARTTLTFLKQAAQFASNFNMELRRIQTLATGFDFSELKNGLLGINAVYGSVIDNAKALYWAYSSGVRGTERDLVKFTEEMAKTAKAINAPIMSTTDAITNMMNAYGYSVQEAGRLGDILFTIVKEGKANAQQLTTALGNVIATASSLGITENELGAATATLTKTMGANKALTILNNIIGKMINPTKESAELMEQLGLDISANAVKAKGFTQVMRELHTATQGNIGVISKLFPDLRGQRAAITLLSTQWEEFEKQLSNFSNVDGARQEALASVTATPEAALAAMGNSLEMIKSKTGDAIIAITTLGGALTPIFNAFNNMGNAGKTALGTFSALAAIGTGLNFVGKAETILKINLENAAVQRNMYEVDMKRNALMSDLSVFQQNMQKKEEEAAQLSLKLAEQKNNEELKGIENNLKAAELTLAASEQQLKSKREEWKINDEIFSQMRKTSYYKIDSSRAVVDNLSLQISDLHKQNGNDANIQDKVFYENYNKLLQNAINSNSQELRLMQSEFGVKAGPEMERALQDQMAVIGKSLGSGVDLNNPDKLTQMVQKIRDVSQQLAENVVAEDETAKKLYVNTQLTNQLLKTWQMLVAQVHNGTRDAGGKDDSNLSINAASRLVQELQTLKRVELGRFNAEVSSATAGANKASIDYSDTRIKDMQKYSTARMYAQDQVNFWRMQKEAKEQELNISQLTSSSEQSKRLSGVMKNAYNQIITDIDNLMKNAELQLKNAIHQGGQPAAQKVMENINAQIRDKQQELAQILSNNQLQGASRVEFNEMGAFKAIGDMTQGMNPIPGMSMMRNIPVMRGVTRALDVGLKPLSAAMSALTLGMGKLTFRTESLNKILGSTGMSFNKIISILAKTKLSTALLSMKKWNSLTEAQKLVFEELGKSMNMTAEGAHTAMGAFSKMAGVIGIASLAAGAAVAIWQLYSGKGGPLADMVEGIAGVNKARRDEDYRDSRVKSYESIRDFYKEYETMGRYTLTLMDSERDLLKKRVELGLENNESLGEMKDAIRNMLRNTYGIGQQYNIANPEKLKAYNDALKEEAEAKKERDKNIKEIGPSMDAFARTRVEKAYEAKYQESVKKLQDARGNLEKSINENRATMAGNIAAGKLKYDLKEIAAGIASGALNAAQKIQNKQNAINENNKQYTIIISGYKDETEAVTEKTKKAGSAFNDVQAQEQKIAKMRSENADKKEIEKEEKELERLNGVYSKSRAELDNFNESIRNNRTQAVELAKALLDLKRQAEQLARQYSDAMKQQAGMMTDRTANDSDLSILRDALINAQKDIDTAGTDIRAQMTVAEQAEVNKKKAEMAKALKDADGDEQNNTYQQAGKEYKEALKRLEQSKRGIQDDEVYHTEEYIKRMEALTKAKKALSDAEVKIIGDATNRIQSAENSIAGILKKRLLDEGPQMGMGKESYKYTWDILDLEKKKIIEENYKAAKEKKARIQAEMGEMMGLRDDTAKYKDLQKELGTYTEDEEKYRKQYKELQHKNKRQKYIEYTKYGNYAQQERGYAFLSKEAHSLGNVREEVEYENKKKQAAANKERDRIFRSGTKAERTNLYVQTLEDERNSLLEQYDKAKEQAEKLLNPDNSPIDQERANQAQVKLKGIQDKLIANYNAERDAMNGLAQAQHKNAQEAYNLAMQLNKMASATANAYSVNSMEAEKLRYRTWERPIGMQQGASRIDMGGINERLDNSIARMENTSKDLATRLADSFVNPTGGVKLEGTDQNKWGEKFSDGIYTFDSSVDSFAKTVQSFELKAKSLVE